MVIELMPRSYHLLDNG
ncbi:hypothetical protein CGLO_18355 [Colletotrichum gloeosporioides Cg-14]|uniref:Uncharacterized protein n=1 Tax=Colletotrichum gloeosporioides (strain Cg-14) TaxID=1237896 RepID=T0JRT9_COLGC|nr:hypothetical protein CGLO_18355 [Colletotrichum gloeosporioides Cg-14]